MRDTVVERNSNQFVWDRVLDPVVERSSTL
jgi:hypothetical protein